jgi:hypothetical protein
VVESASSDQDPPEVETGVELDAETPVDDAVVGEVAAAVDVVAAAVAAVLVAAVVAVAAGVLVVGAAVSATTVALVALARP